MFNNKLKKFALGEHDKALHEYNNSQEVMNKRCGELYETRKEAIIVIHEIQDVINSIANTPKEFDVQMGKINEEYTKFRNTEKYAEEAFNESVKTGINIGASLAMGAGTAAIAPAMFMNIATTFGTASTGTAISALSGAAAQKAAVAWIGRTFAGFAVKGGAGMVAGKAFLALTGPIGWGIAGVSSGISLWLMSKKNEEIAQKCIDITKDIYVANEAMRETIVEILKLKTKTDILCHDLSTDKDKINGYINADYDILQTEDKYYLGTLVNNTHTLSALLNQTIE